MARITAFLLGFISGYLLFDGLALLEIALLATMLAPTDAALGKAVVTNTAVPDKIREGLNVESGLNDGICVPILLIFLALATSESMQGSVSLLALELVSKAIGSFGWHIVVYSLLSLTIVRMLPVFLVLGGMKLRPD